MTTLDTADTDAVATLLVTAYPDLAGPLKERRVMTKVEEQPFFPRTRIVNVLVDKHPPPPVTIFVAAGEGGALTVLSRRVAALADIARLDPPSGLDQVDRARAYAHAGDRWTSEHTWGFFAIESFDDLPLRKVLEPRDKPRLEEARTRAAARIAPEKVEPVDGGFKLSFWVVAEQKIVFRELTVLATGELRRQDEIVAEKIPTYLGKLWGRDARGRWVPTG